MGEEAKREGREGRREEGEERGREKGQGWERSRLDLYVILTAVFVFLLCHYTEQVYVL